jgi:hypothetical protein
VKAVVVLVVLLGAACADQTYVSADASADLGTDLVPDGWMPTDWGPSPDGLPPALQKMYAHSQQQLFAIDPDTLALSPVGSFFPNAPDINDLAVTPGGEIYGISINDLYLVDATTAEISHVTSVQGTANVALTFEVGGTLLASDKLGALRRIDPKTGQVTEIGSYGTDLGESGDLVAIKDGTLFGVNDVGPNGSAKSNNDLLTIDPSTGAATVVGPIGFDRVWGLAYWKGVVYGLTRDGELLSIDPATGAGTLVSSFSYEFWGAAVTPIAPIE